MGTAVLQRTKVGWLKRISMRHCLFQNISLIYGTQYSLNQGDDVLGVPGDNLKKHFNLKMNRVEIESNRWAQKEYVWTGLLGRL